MATTVIDAFITTFGLDATQYKKGAVEVDKNLEQLQKRAKTTATDMAKSGREGAQFFASMRNEAVKFFAALAGSYGLKELVVGLTDANVQLDDFSVN